MTRLFLIPTWGTGSPDTTLRLPGPKLQLPKESPMFNKFRNAFPLKNDANMYSYLPARIQKEIKSDMEATSVYDLR